MWINIKCNKKYLSMQLFELVHKLYVTYEKQSLHKNSIRKYYVLSAAIIVSYVIIRQLSEQIKGKLTRLDLELTQ